MIRTIAAMFTAVALTFGLVTAAAADGANSRPVPGSVEPGGVERPDPYLPLCATEDTVPADGACVWDALHQGNGDGRSFLVLPSGRVVYIGHRTAQRLTDPLA